MIWYYILYAILNFLNFAISALPRVEVLPLGMDEALTTAVTYFKSFMEIFPPFQIIYTAFMFYMGFRITLLVLKLFRVIR